MVLYDLIMRLNSNTLLQGSNAGKMINIAANDLELYEFLTYTPLIVSIPAYHIMVLIVMAIFFKETALYALFISILMLTSNVFIGKLSKIIRKSLGEITDNRVKLMKNIIEGIRIVKLYGWDEGLLNLMYEFRNRECKKQSMKHIPRIVLLAIGISGVGLVVMSISMVHLSIGYEMTLSESVLLISLYGQMFIVSYDLFGIAVELSQQMLVNNSRIT